ncbi:ABC transporter substrate-binding protein [Hahella aquimaris]|uniref:substrate-binding periplasmic protein n=1 Tax=Hahella sp. HNIBRBA332 TaxID=3015983 RepID=UPI00273B581B|nr:ABC transporter substrate-binding protein [Hahella sp. HNIBRBA332]WLQ12543.1 ABC transporter substrate-binding protein [Hahella sp. HNIBRBA332]
MRVFKFLIAHSFHSLLLALFLGAGSASAAEKVETFLLVTENYPPYNMSMNNSEYEHSGDQIYGVSADIVKMLFERAKLPYNMKLRAWHYAFEHAQRKAYRGVFSTTRTEERESMFKWVGPLVEDSWVAFSRPNESVSITSIDDLKKYRVGGYKGDIASEYLIEKGVNVSLIDDDTLNLKRLYGKYIDLWISGPYSGPYYAKQAGYPSPQPAYVFNQAEMYLALNVDTPQQYVDLLNETLAKMRSEGKIDEIIARYR